MFVNAAEEAQSRLHVEIIPGTEILTDLEDTHFIRGGRQAVVLVPQPTSDPHDPLVGCRSVPARYFLKADEYSELDPFLEVRHIAQLLSVHVSG